MKKKMLAKNSPPRLHHHLITSAQKSRSNNSTYHEKIRPCSHRCSARHVRSRRGAGANYLYRRKIRAHLAARGTQRGTSRRLVALRISRDRIQGVVIATIRSRTRNAEGSLRETHRAVRRCVGARGDSAAILSATGGQRR